MQILDNLIILFLIVLAFFVGVKMSDRFNERIIDELRYQMKLMAAQMGVGYVAPPVKRRRANIGPAFFKKMQEEGKAVQQIPPAYTAEQNG